MLPTETDTLIRDSIDVYLKAQGFRPPRGFGQRVLAQSFAGEVIQPAKIAAVTMKEIETVSAGVMNAIQKVVDNVQIRPYENLRDDLLKVFDHEFDTCAAVIRKFVTDSFRRLSSNTATVDWVDNKLEDARKARHLELKLLAASVAKSEESATRRMLYNSNNQCVGIVDPSA
jgi:hypothetical protein